MPTFDSEIKDFVAGDDLEITRTITSVPSSDTLATAWFTVKHKQSDADGAAIILKKITSSNVAGTGQITDTGADGTGALRFDLTDVDTAKLEEEIGYLFDVQVVTTAGAVYTPEIGTITARLGMTVAIA